MTLKEKFEEFTEQKSYERTNYDAQECEKIADDYAIEFAKWIINNRVEFFDDTSSGEIYTYGQYHSKYSMKEISEIFKKEKRL
jgi:hypothetical protein